jgi:hypothetical protein
MSRDSVLQIGFVDIAAVLFVVGGVASLVMSLLTIPVVSAQLPVTFITVFFVILAIDLICSLGALHCYTLATKRMLSEAGMRGLIFGALLLIFSLGFVANFIATNSTVILAELSAVLVLVGGIICFALRYTTLSSSPVMQVPISQPVLADRKQGKNFSDPIQSNRRQAT